MRRRFRPVIAGRRPRTIVSTSGSSGIGQLSVACAVADRELATASELRERIFAGALSYPQCWTTILNQFSELTGYRAPVAGSLPSSFIISQFPSKHLTVCSGYRKILKEIN